MPTRACASLTAPAAPPLQRSTHRASTTAADGQLICMRACAPRRRPQCNKSASRCLRPTHDAVPARRLAGRADAETREIKGFARIPARGWRSKFCDRILGQARFKSGHAADGSRFQMGIVSFPVHQLECPVAAHRALEWCASYSSILLRSCSSGRVAQSPVSSPA